MNFKRFIYEDENDNKDKKPFDVAKRVDELELGIFKKEWLQDHLEEIAKYIIDHKKAQAAFWVLRNLPNDKQIPELISVVETTKTSAYMYLRDLIYYKDVPVETIQEKLPTLIDAAIDAGNIDRAMSEIFVRSDQNPPLKVMRLILDSPEACVKFMNQRYFSKNIPESIKHKAFEQSATALSQYLRRNPEELRDENYYKYFFRHAGNDLVPSFIYNAAELLNFKDIPQPLLDVILSNDKTASQYYDHVGFEGFDPKDYKKILGSAKTCLDFVKKVLKFKNVPQEVIDKIATNPTYGVNYIL